MHYTTGNIKIDLIILSSLLIVVLIASIKGHMDRRRGR
jgi:hypothetical protein